MSKTQDRPKWRRGPLTKAEQFYVEHNPDSLTVEDLSTKLNKNPELIKKYLNKAKAQVETVQEEVQPEPEQKNTSVAKAGKLMGRKRGAVVSTGAASQVSDEFRKTLPKKETRYSSAIHRPMSGEEQ